MIDPRLQRTWWIAGAGVALVVAVALLGWSSRRCAIVVHNDSPVPRGGVLFITDDWRWEVELLPAEGSRRRTVPNDVAGGTWRVGLGQTGDPGRELWFEPGPGRRLMVHIRRDGTIRYDTRPAWWELP